MEADLFLQRSQKETRAMLKISYKEQELKEHTAKLSYPSFLRANADNVDFMNWISHTLAFFIFSTVLRPVPQYTWLDLPVPDQFIELLGGSKKITIDYSGGKKIRIYR